MASITLNAAVTDSAGNVVHSAALTLTQSVSGASPDGTYVPPASQIVDNSGNVYTISGNAILINGSNANGGFGSIITWCGGTIRVLGTDNNWWAWTGVNWTNVGATDPCLAMGFTTTALVATPTVVSVGNPITLTATVKPSNASGTVTFLEGTSVLGSATLANGTASITVTLPLGTHSIHAHYSGN